MFNAFPVQQKHDISIVSSLILRKTYGAIQIGRSEADCTYTLLDGQTVTFPYRIYYLDEDISLSALTREQRIIYHCFFSRSCDGFVREKHIRALLREDYPDWVLPYLVKVADEYVVEILSVLYDELKDKNNEKIKLFCRQNMQSLLYGHARMISYWNEFYRDQCYSYKDYIGKKLFEQCFGYTRGMEKERKRHSAGEK